jgi:hypothetical protein
VADRRRRHDRGVTVRDRIRDAGVSTWVAVAAAIAITMPRFLLDSTDSIQSLSVPWAVGLTAWWCAPLFLLMTTARLPVIRYGGVLAYLAVAALVLPAVYRDTSSTAIFGVVLVPVYLTMAVVVVVGADRLVCRRTRRSA